MFKRQDNNVDDEYSVPAKRPKYETKKGAFHSPGHDKDPANKKYAKGDDIWGTDFAEEDIEEMDFVASQVSIQESSATQSNICQDVSLLQRKISMPSTSKNLFNKNNLEIKTPKVSLHTRQLNSQKRTGQSPSQFHNISRMNYKDFEEKLMDNNVNNSTFALEDKVVISESTYLKELEKLKLENQKLLNDFITKDGEAVFLRNQLQQTQLRAEKDRSEKTRFIEDQVNKHRSDINNICKEKEYLKTQLELQTFEIGNLMERCKLLESGNIKLIEPHTVNLNNSINKTKCNSPLNRSFSTKQVKVKEKCVQTNLDNRSSYVHKTWNPYYPLAKMSSLLYDSPQPEKSIVDIQNIEKTGKRNLPILQEEDTFRIFENPKLVKPVITIIDDKRLTTEFILSEVTALQRMTDLELESEHSIPIINKLVSTARELILNAIVVLQTVFQTMRNDDIRDMNDIYFSDLYVNPSLTAKSICDAHAWHETERGVEARRVFGVLSYVALESTYLSKYIAGRTKLLTERDESYQHYSRQMIRHNTWPSKDQEFEMLNMILEFVVLVGSTRRSHQFSGLLCAIMLIVYNVNEKISYCSRGMDYVFKIFREIVLSRPLPFCYVPLSNVLTIFVKSVTHLRKVCFDSQLMAVSYWKGALHFTPDACLLQILLVQMEDYQSDLIATIDITHSLILFVQYVLHTNVFPMSVENPKSCNCCLKLLRFTIKMLRKCSEVNLNHVKGIKANRFCVSNSCGLEEIRAVYSLTHAEMSKEYSRELFRLTFSDDDSWADTKRKQYKVLKDGLRLLCHLAICDPDFLIRLSDIEDSFHSFIQNISTFDNFILHENEKEAMNQIQETFILDKTPQPDVQSHEGSSGTNQLQIQFSNFGKRSICPASKKIKNRTNNKILTVFKSICSKKRTF